MPEGPSILHIRNQLLPFKNRVVKKAGGYGPMPAGWINGKKLLDIKTWGKHLLLLFANGTVRVHLGLFGDILINERKKVNRSFFLEFTNGEINGYVVRAEKLKAPVTQVYDWRTDILSKDFDMVYVKKLLKMQSGKTIGDVLMDQQIFTGAGNIIRNEVLYLAGIHPQSIVGKIPAAKITKLIKETVKYAKHWYEIIERNKHLHFSVYRRQYAADGSEVTMKILSRSKRKIFFSEYRQRLYE
ncbi:DNA-formamidopyrimidine glycosylase family protein [Parafilimonas terrae]|uniref:Endonuclease-8 n=1 Tax=Parafilimonas terrae TaxID=1465490 RepID=A0A1I5Y0X4_9BACT|nr:DNA-formamidopyrimidine glycosylase family protein [Parafilimonas terrae]SFQ37637.1 endonuclease-8 [Parafilimonas terrae]